MSAVQSVLFAILGIIIMLVSLAVAVGWIVPLVMGIVRKRRGGRSTALLAVGIIWGMMALSLTGIFVFSVASLGKRMGESSPGKVESFNPAGYNGPTGKILIPYKGESSIVVSSVNGKRLRLSARDGVMLAPAGIYKIQEYQATCKDSQDNTWTASNSGIGMDGQGEIYVSPDEPVRLSAGPPFTVLARAAHSGPNTASFDLAITGCDGQSYQITKEKSKSPAGFEVLSGQKVVWHGKFEAG